MLAGEHLDVLKTKEKVEIRFVNKTDRPVEIISIPFEDFSYDGEEEFMTFEIPGNQFFDMHTYKNRPWIVLDSKTKDKLVIEECSTYIPKLKEHFREKNPEKHKIHIEEGKLIAKITLPFYTLKEKSFIEVRNLLRSPNDVDQLELPVHIAERLRTRLSLRDMQVEK